LEVYPNPAGDQLTRQSPKNSITHYQLQTLTGQTLKTGKPESRSTHTLNVGQVPTRVYLLQVRSDHGVMTKKVVVE